jgi:hypothetical protein
MANLKTFRTTIIPINSTKVNQLVMEIGKNTVLNLKEITKTGDYQLECTDTIIGFLDSYQSSRIKELASPSTKWKCNVIQVAGGGMFDYAIAVEFSEIICRNREDFCYDEDMICKFDYDSDGNIEIGAGYSSSGYNSEGYDSDGLDEWGYDEDMNGAHDD